MPSRFWKLSQRLLQCKRPTTTAKSLQSCPTLCDPRDGSPPGSPVPGILQARTLEWAAISFSSAWKWQVKVKSLRRLRLLATPWAAAYQASPSWIWVLWTQISICKKPLPCILLLYFIYPFFLSKLSTYSVPATVRVAGTQLPVLAC